MNYLLINFSDTHLSAIYNNNERNYPFHLFNQSYHDLLEIIKNISIDYSDIIGGVIKTLPQHNNDDVFSVTTSDGKTVNLPNLFSELINKPFVGEVSHELASQEAILQALKKKEEHFSWSIEYAGLSLGKEEYCHESLLTVANGYIGLRGTLPEMTISHDYYPATYIAGLYNQAESQIGDHNVVNEDFVNAPNGQFIALKIGQGDYLLPNNLTTLSLNRNLDLKTGVMRTKWVVQAENGKQLIINSLKFANMADMSYYCIQYQFTPLNFSDEITVITKLEGDTYNAGVERYRSLNSHHYEVLSLAAEKNIAYLQAQTFQSKIGISLSSNIQGDFFSPQDIVCTISDSVIEQSITFAATQGRCYTLEKCVAVETSTAYPDSWNKFLPCEFPSLQSQLTASQNAWQTLWEKADIVVSGDLMTQKLLRLHTYHLLSSASPFSNEKNQLDVSVTARGLHGEAYRGHIFWDELFIFPFYIMHFPETARQLLLYRYHRLDAARLAAQAEGFQGAMFPWQSGLDGTEQTQVLHLNPLSGQWDPDHSCRQRHVSLAIAYNVWLYWCNTLDSAFMKDYGLELLSEITLFWVSQSQWDNQDQRYHISGVMGPDEFHEKYANSTEGGLRDNAYTNIMVAWLFNEISRLYDQNSFTDALINLGINSEVITKVKEIKTQLAITLNQDEVIEQFSGYFDLEDLDWDGYRQKYGNIYRMDRILRKENKSADDFKVAKQADTLMLFNNFDKDAIQSLIESLGHPVSEHFAEKNLHYYLERTSHGSTLSRIVHAYLAEQIQLHDLSWKLYQEALYSDYNDVQGGTTAEGIHTGVMAATLNTTIMAYAGVDIRSDLLHITPALPKQWEALSFTLSRRNALYQISITHEQITIICDKDNSLLINNKDYQLTANTSLTINLNGNNKNV